MKAAKVVPLEITPERILVAEPDSLYRAELVARLRGAGHQVAVVDAAGTDGPDRQLQQIEGLHPSLLIVDVDADHGADDGVIAQARAAAGEEPLPVLLLGDPDHPELVTEAISLGGVVYLQRGAHWDAFDRTLATVCARRDAAGTPS